MPDVQWTGPSTRLWRCLLLGHNEAESEGLLLGYGNASYLAMTKPNRTAFYSAAAMPPTRPWWSRAGQPSTRGGEVSDSAMTMRSRKAIYGGEQTGYRSNFARPDPSPGPVGSKIFGTGPGTSRDRFQNRVPSPTVIIRLFKNLK